MFVNPEIALYPGSALLFFSLAVLVRHPIVKGALAVAAFYLTLHLIFMEYLELLQREMSRAVLAEWWKVGLVDVGYILGFTLVSMPFVFGIAAIARSSSGDIFWFRRFKRLSTLFVLVPATVVVAVVLLNRPVYDARWQRMVSVEQRCLMGADSSSLSLTSGEPLNGLRMVFGGRDTVLANTGNSFVEHLESGVDWVTVIPHNAEVGESAGGDTLRTILRTLEFLGDRRPLRLDVRYTSDEAFESKSRWSTRSRADRTTKSEWGTRLTWYSYPDSNLRVPVELILKPGQKVIESIKLVYPQLAGPAQFERDLTIVTARTVVTRTDTIVAQ